MLPKQKRLKGKEMNYVFKKCKNFKGSFLILKLSKTIFDASLEIAFGNLKEHESEGRVSMFKLAKQEVVKKEEGGKIESSSRFAVIVPLRVSKKAVKRNRLKRLIREVLRKKISEIKPGFDGIFMALPGILEKNYWEIEKEIEKLIDISNLRLRN